MDKKAVKTALLSLITLVTLSTFVLPVNAATITPLTKSYNVAQEDLQLDELKYKNDSKVSETITLTVSAYDAKSEKALTDKPFISLKKTTFTVKAGQEIKIPYIFAIPKETPVGSYFNVIYFQKKEGKKTTTDSNVSIIPSIGVLFSFHVQDSTTSISQLFFNQSDIKLEVTKKGLPYLFPTEFVYTYTNNSNFVFKPEGEIRILDTQGQQILDRFEINPEHKAVYPGETITKTYSVKLWSDYKSIMESKNIVSKTYSDIDSTPVLNKVTVSVLYQVVLLIALAAIILIAALVSIISTVVRKVKAKKN